MLGIGLSRSFLLSATVLMGLPLCRPAYAAFPVGAFVVVDPASSNDTSVFGTGTNITNLFGPELCTTSPPYICHGGITGVFLNVQWDNFQSTVRSYHPGATTVVLDAGNQLTPVMQNLESIDSDAGVAGRSPR